MEKLLLSRREAAATLSISAVTLDKMRKSGDCPQSIKLGDRVLFPRQSLINFIEQQKQLVAA